MKSIVYWRVFVNSTKESTVKKLLTPLLEVLGATAQVEKQETYWKDSTLTEVNISQPIEFQNFESGLSNTIGIEISGVADATSMNGITWVSFDVVHE